MLEYFINYFDYLVLYVILVTGALAYEGKYFYLFGCVSLLFIYWLYSH